MDKYDEIAIFGCGGVGSWIAEFIVRNDLAESLILVDYDDVEAKNLRRQNYLQTALGHRKCEQLSKHLETISPQTAISPIHRKIREDIDLVGIDENAVALILTDNIHSKRFIGQHFHEFLMVNCDRNFVEVKNYLSRSDIAAWDMGGGYANNQDIFSNLYAANVLFYLLKNRRLWRDRKVKLKRKVEDDVEGYVEVMEDAPAGD